MQRRQFLASSLALSIFPIDSTPATANRSKVQLARYFCLDEQCDVPLGIGGAPMPFDSTFMQAGVYSLGGQSWNCSRTGVYRFMIDGEPFLRNRIVLASPLDVYELISAICWNHVHGVADETNDMQHLSNLGRYQRWRLRCGYIVDLVVWLLPQLGMTGRKLNPYTLEERNGFDDGHVVLETQHGSEWRMWDLTNSCYWRNAQGKHLSTVEFIAHIANGAPMPRKVILDGDQQSNSASVPVEGGILDLGLYNDLYVVPNQEDWFRRIFQAV